MSTTRTNDPSSSSAAALGLLRRALIKQSRELRDLQGSRASVIDCGEFSDERDLGLAFFRDAAGPRRPALMRGAAAASGFDPGGAWTEELFLELAGGPETVVTVAETPDGRADAVAEVGADGGGGRVFARPREKRTTLGDLLGALHVEFETLSSSTSPAPPPPPPDGIVRYAQAQDNSAEEEFPRLLEVGAVPRRIGWAERAFVLATPPPSPPAGGPRPEAINVWAGGPRSTTSWHRDHYENLHYVLCGEKVFHLLPPSEGWRLERKRRKAARYAGVEGQGEQGPREKRKLSLVVEKSPARRVLWSSAPTPRSCSTDDALEFTWLYGPSALAAGLPRPLEVVVRAGDCLYLPPLWFHCVENGASCPVTICVNYWYDMHFDDRFASAKLCDGLESVVRALGGGGGDDDDESSSEGEGEESE